MVVDMNGSSISGKRESALRIFLYIRENPSLSILITHRYVVCVKIYSRRRVKICNKWNYFKPFLIICSHMKTQSQPPR